MEVFQKFWNEEKINSGCKTLHILRRLSQSELDVEVHEVTIASVVVEVGAMGIVVVDDVVAVVCQFSMMSKLTVVVVFPCPCLCVVLNMVVVVAGLVEQLDIHVGDDKTVCQQLCSKAICVGPVVNADLDSVVYDFQHVVLQQVEILAKVPCRISRRE